jgi:CMP-N-acetylneuraminic acid synthetase
MTRHVAFIPARLGSKGLPLKNRLLFPNTADFLECLDWIDEIVISTDDPVLAREGQGRGYTILERPKQLAGDAIAIKTVIEGAVAQMNLAPSAVLWLFYLPILYKNKVDFEDARKILDSKKIESLCTFIPAKTHPFNCWQYSTEKGELSQFIENNRFRRQDLPEAWMLYHYICCCRVSCLPKLNNELVCKQTYPIFLPKEVADRLIEIDTPEDLARWKVQQIES